MAEHTKGPWTAHPYNSRMGSLISFGDLSKGETIGIAYGQENEEEGKANARLIAAAPELLEALKNLVDLAKNRVADAEEWHDYQHAVAVIVKAEGCK